VDSFESRGQWREGREIRLWSAIVRRSSKKELMIFGRFEWAADVSRKAPKKFTKHWNMCKVRKRMLAML
jgi:hypothetical protein